MAEHESPAVFERGYLYFKDAEGDLQQELVESEESYAALKQAGWQDSPAAFGVETHPTGVGQRMPLTPGDPQLETLQQLLKTIQEVVQTMQGRVSDAMERLARLEGAAQAAQALPPHEAGETEPTSRRRSS